MKTVSGMGRFPTTIKLKNEADSDSLAFSPIPPCMGVKTGQAVEKKCIHEGSGETNLLNSKP